MKLFKGQLFVEETGVNFRADVPAAMEESPPVFHWEGGRIPQSFFVSFMAFSVWAHAEHRCETQARLYHSNRERRFYMLLPPQSGSGVSTSDELVPDLGAVGFPEDCVLLGSFHSHPGFAAFQSGVDAHDERLKDGIHFTFGWKDCADIHARVSYRGFFYTPVISEWVEVPQELMAFSERVREAWFQDWSRALYPTADQPDALFPAEWKEVVKVPEPEVGGLWDEDDWMEPLVPRRHRRRLRTYRLGNLELEG